MKKIIKHKKLKITIILVLVVLICISSLGVGYFYYKTSKIKRTPISRKNSDLGITQETDTKFKQFNKIVNIALFGLDTRVKDKDTRSDCIMIVSLDGMHNKIKILSIMRDTAVNVDGYGMTKITHAYYYGGPQLAIKTINENFGLNVKDFVKVDFFSLEKIIDNLGGLEINVMPDELKYLNGYIDETSYIEKVPPEHVAKAGLQLLNGRQAVAYCRIRYTIGDDFKRTERQRDVLELIIDKLKTKSKEEIISTINTLLPYAETSMSNTQILNYSLSVVSSRLYDDVEKERFPVDGYCWAADVNGMDCISTDLPTTASQMQDYIFNDKKPVPKTRLVY